MTKRDRKALGEYIRWVADQMELRDWTFELDLEPCESHLAGCVVCTNGARHATITVAANFRGYPPDEQRETIVHELVHVHWETCWKMVQTDLGDALGKPVYYVFCDSYRRGMEYGIDSLSKALAKHLPHIRWPEPGAR
jgi:hypothetical protein